MTAPKAMTASCLRASSCATTGISTAPATCTTTGSAAPEFFTTLSALASMGSTIGAFHLVDTIPTDRPEASMSLCSGRPSPLMDLSCCYGWELPRDAGQVVTHAVALGTEVGHVVVGDEGGHGNALVHGDTVLFQRLGLVRVVGEQADRGNPQVLQDLGARPELAGVGGQTEAQVRVDGVGTGVLEAVGTQFVQQADTAALVPAEVDDGAAPLGCDLDHGGLELGAAVTAVGAEGVAGQAFRV